MENLIKVYMGGRNYQAEGFYNLKDGSLKVLKGSRVVREEASSFRAYYHNVAKMRADLIKDGVIQDYEFVEDYTFDIPFHASAIIQTNGQAGHKAWKTSDGITIEAILTSKDNLDKFKSFLDLYRPSKNKKEIDKIIKDFQERFPLEKLKELSIEEYDKTGDNTTLSYAIEHGTNEIFKGFLGNNRNKIFYNTRDGEYEVIEWLKNKYFGMDILEIFEKYKKDLYNLIKNFDKDSYISGEVGAVPANTNTIRSKLIMLYRPYELLHLSSVTVFKKIFNYFAIPYDNSYDSIEMNIRFKAYLERNINTNKDVVGLSEAIWNFYENVIDKKDAKLQPVIDRSNFEDLFIDDTYIGEIVSVLKRKKNIILRGVPGVGKTYCIKTIIKGSFDNLMEDSIEMIQFHQSYSYEEFMEGLRPQMSGGFEIEKGIFYDISIRARDNPEIDYFLIIDEINRGNLSKIFGELLLLIENDKREDYSVRLPYSKEEFTVPSNLYIIGTMNTADRSLTLFDYALRRRFSFLTLEPAFGTNKFNSYLENEMHLNSEQINRINTKMIEINSIIGDSLGNDFRIGHSYFISSKEDMGNFDDWYNEIIKYEIMPILEEYYYDDLDRVQEFRSILNV